MKRKTLPIKRTSRQAEMPVFNVISHPESCQSFAAGGGNLMVIPLFSGTVVGDYLEHIDDQLHGEIHRAIESSGFSASAGEVLTINVSNTLRSGEKKIILIAGLGEPGDFSSRTLCGLFRLAIQQAEKEEVSTLTIPIQPHRATEGAINLKGSAAILRCRTFETLMASGLEHLKEVRIVAAPQARRYIREGLSLAMPLCAECGNYRLC